jgi:Mg-chelatase subunit ChlD
MSLKFKKDWWRRKEEDAFSFYDPSKKLFDWDSGRTGYSSYFVRDNQNLRSAAKMIGSMFRVIGVPKNFKLEHSIKKKTVKDDVTVPVPLAMLRDEQGNYMNHNTKLLDAFYGSSIQNAALATMQTKSEYTRTMNARNTENVTMRELMYTLLNTERIDKKLADRFPGYSKFVQKFKQYKYDETYEPLDSNEHAGKRLAETVAKFIRYPAHITEEEVEEFAKPLSQIENYMKKHGFPKTSDDCDKQASYLSGVINKFIKAEDKKEEEEPPGGPGGPGSGDEDDDSNPGSAPSPSKDDMDELAKQLMKALVNPDDGDSSEEFAEDFQDFTEDMEEKKNLPPTNHDFSKDGTLTEGNIKFKKSDTDKDKYFKDLTKINSTKAQVLAKLFARKSKDYTFSMKSMRSGRLDTNKLAEAKQMVPTIYERFGQVTTNKINIGVVIDESGSMGSCEKMQKARQAAIFINEVFKKQQDVQLFIYGHTADESGGYGDCNIRIYREPGVNMDPYALGSCRARSNNRDGDAIYACARRIRSKTTDPGLIFVISDGAPYAYGYDGQQAIEDTRKKVTMAQALGFQVIQIAIEEEVPCDEMFDYYIQMTNIENLPNDMIAYVSKKVDKLIKEKTIM